MNHDPLSILVVEDHALVAMELEAIIEEAGHVAAGWATNFQEACDLIVALGKVPDLAFVDVDLGDGPSGVDVAATLRGHDVGVIFMTANAKRLAEDMHGAIGTMAKPYSSNAVLAALTYLLDGVRAPPPACVVPAGFRLSPRYMAEWRGSEPE